MANSSQPKSWRDVLPIHPCADLFPPIPEAELKELAGNIEAHELGNCRWATVAEQQANRRPRRHSKRRRKRLSLEALQRYAAAAKEWRAKRVQS